MRKTKVTLTENNLTNLFPEFPDLGTLPRKKKKQAKKNMAKIFTQRLEAWVKSEYPLL